MELVAFSVMAVFILLVIFYPSLALFLGYGFVFRSSFITWLGGFTSLATALFADGGDIYAGVFYLISWTLVIPMFAAAEWLWEKTGPVVLYMLNTSISSEDVQSRSRYEDETYWKSTETNTNGFDCNGKQGPGNYCWCLSQGYNCGCDYEEMDEVKKVCYDHQGFDCDGRLVDGELRWCYEESSFYTALNKKWRLNKRLQME
jgi:hypothetical protein